MIWQFYTNVLPDTTRNYTRDGDGHMETQTQASLRVLYTGISSSRPLGIKPWFPLLATCSQLSHPVIRYIKKEHILKIVHK